MNKSEFCPVDLKLPEEDAPADLETFRKDESRNYQTIHDHVSSTLQTFAIGQPAGTEKTYSCRLGLFDGIKVAWKNHWNLRTSPEDWWFPVACRIARAIDKAAQDEDDCSVRKHFVSHRGKQKIEVKLPYYTIYDTDYKILFSKISSVLERRIKVPAFAKSMQSDFSTTTPAQQIASQINLMASMKEFFTYSGKLLGCGLKGLEMRGSQADWDRLVLKLLEVEEQLKPILSALKLEDNWFRHVEKVFRQLSNTYANPESHEVHDFWADIMMVSEAWKRGPSGRRQEAGDYNGWLIRFLTGKKSFNAQKLRDKNFQEELKGLNSVPISIKLTWVEPAISDIANLKAGIIGFSVHDPMETFNQVPSLELTHVWAMLLPEDSPLRLTRTEVSKTLES